MNILPPPGRANRRSDDKRFQACILPARGSHPGHTLAAPSRTTTRPEDLNAEIAETIKPGDRRDEGASDRRQEQTIEIVEAILIAVVAVATAWGGYQAARWDGHQAELYGESSTERNEADQALTLGGQRRLLDITTFNTWIEARELRQDGLAALYERRFSPEFRVAFEAWIALDPFDNPNAPPGPSFMPQ